jgi:hypothetical protein
MGLTGGGDKNAGNPERGVAGCEGASDCESGFATGGKDENGGRFGISPMRELLRMLSRITHVNKKAIEVLQTR